MPRHRRTKSPERPANTYRALLINDGVITPIDLRNAASGATHMHELIGDYFCQCFAIPIGGGRMIVGHCDDNFLRKNLPLNVILTRDIYDHDPNMLGYPIHGPIVVTAVIPPDTADMTDEECSRFFTEDHEEGRLLRLRPDPNQEIWDEMHAVMGAATAFEQGGSFDREVDGSFDQILREADTAIAQGGMVFQKWTCKGCGKRQTIDKPNSFFTGGKCEECGHETDLRKEGCGFMAFFGDAEVQRIVAETIRKV